MPQPQAKHLAVATSALMEAMTARATVAEIFMVGGVSWGWCAKCVKKGDGWCWSLVFDEKVRL
jgi:hypothetical protein